MISKDLKPIKFEHLKTHENRASSSAGTKRNKKKQSDRFFINIGARDEYEWTSLKDFLKAKLKVGRDDIFQVEVMKNFSFFSMNHGYKDLVLNTFSNFHIDNRRVSVELTKKEKQYFSASKKKTLKHKK